VAVALLQGNSYRFGSAAVSAARLRPRDVNTRYWWQLSTEALQPKLGPARHTGDLVHAHLNALFDEAGKPGELLLAIPGSMQREQLSLLLGIINECPFNAVGLVHRSALLASLCMPGERTYHLELQLHQALLSEVVAQGREVRIERSVPLPGVGLLALQEALVAVAADAFVRQTRFDPRRQAATEQVLYDALPGVLTELATASETNIEVDGYRARISNRDIDHIADALCQRVAEQVAGTQVMADARVGWLPGITRNLPDLALLAADELRDAAEAQGDRLVQRTEHLDFVTRLPSLGNRAAATAPTPSTPAGPNITHLLEGGVARAVNGSGEALAAGWSLGQTESGWQLWGGAGEVRVNDTGYQPEQLLKAGDTIHIPGASPVTLIAVQD
ncbi:MAG: hypothetical protein HKN19_09045, partial [Halioglobus sp.]|nr:hypothetical protein [Halioglobus sp.]